jgi:murein DD-endopeptidase MepM/ murein hydrolase activator NlpD
MNIIVIGKGSRPRQLNLAHPITAVAAVATLFALAGALFATGWWVAVEFGPGRPQEQLVALRAELNQQRADLDSARRAADEDLNAYAVRLGQLNAHVIRLDALGDRLTRMAKLDKGEFNFDQPPATGGPEVILGDGRLPALDFQRSLDDLAGQIQDREKQLAILENLLMNRNLQSQVRPAGRPVEQGWISSYFGIRSDPFTGNRAAHYGVDFAGRMGDPIQAVAAGVVTYAGQRFGYGLMVEVNHGNGYATRYAHCSETLVRVGDTVKKGQLIAKMGSSGRATGPHVHFEVLQGGKLVNPQSYINAQG